MRHTCSQLRQFYNNPSFLRRLLKIKRKINKYISASLKEAPVVENMKVLRMCCYGHVLRLVRVINKWLKSNLQLTML